MIRFFQELMDHYLDSATEVTDHENRRWHL